ncbi:malto-oligosyltrehalose trehalohydrolase [Luteimonas deserti]|uniref:Malto-oligosyltrehalose trehalohydrolase n=1 Tax=Luteimonas deserti TaxID=2752306 RepID=A0A7Z0QQF6_9GAMM|nr:malto-oligosyltrehalose trehalohydrolase [Luteimonas deserti]NYZ62056.1 malto-oligosyltrehalose trehalohydrolase [Luteimonas deserti]
MRGLSTTPAWGARLDGDSVHFAVWAPACTQAWLVPEDAAPVPMSPDGHGGFSLSHPGRPGLRYRYRLDAATVPDPASRWQPEGVDGPSAVHDPDAYSWHHTAWHGRPWNEVVLYEAHVGACGGYTGLQRQLPALAAMGITAVELMPVAEFPGRRNWGYDGVLPYAPASAYGSPDALKALVDAAHGLGLQVFLDVVYNHFGPHGNHLSAYAPDFFRDDVATPWGAAIDFTRPQVRRYFIDNALMWLHDYRIDGLRLDAVHAIAPPAFLDQLRDAIRASLPPDRHVHLVLENEGNTASWLGPDGYDAQWNDDFHNALHVLLTGEREGYYAAFADAPEAHLARVLGEGFAYQGQPDPRGHVRGEPSAQVAPCHFVAFAQNHDQIGNRAFGDRLVTSLAEPRLRAALALTALTPMVPLFFMGEPWGARQPFPFFADFPPPLDEAVREGRRREFAQFAAFADPARRARIPDPNAEATFEAARVAIADAGTTEGARWVAWFTALLAVRRAQLTPRLCDLRADGAGVLAPGVVHAAWRDAERRLDAVLNLGDAPIDLAAAGIPSGAGHYRSDGAPDDAVLPPDTFLLRWRDAA